MTDDTESSAGSDRNNIATAIQRSSEALQDLAKYSSDLSSETSAGVAEAASQLQGAQQELDGGEVDLSRIIDEVRSVNDSLSDIVRSTEQVPSAQRQAVEDLIQQSQDELDLQ